MPAQTAQPTILVKKADGTTVRMTLDEVKKMRSGGKDPSASPSAPVGMTGDDKKTPTAPPPINLPMVEEPQLPATAAPFAVYEHPKMPEPVKKPVPARPTEIPDQVRNDSKKIALPQPAKESVKLTSPITETKNTAVGAVQPAGMARMGRVDEVISNIGFTVPADYVNRLRSLIQLRLKDVRDEGQTKETAMRTFRDGGLQLNEEQAKKLVEACRTKSVAPASVPRMPEVETIKAAPKKEVLPPPAVPRKEIPDLGIRAAEKVLPRPVVNMPTAKTVIQDVVAKPANMGPVEEIKYFNLTDFRRLASDPAEAASRLRQKFIALKEESYLMYLDALRVWIESPLYASYMEALHNAIVNKQGLAVNLVDKTKIQMPEMQAIINMEKDLI